MLNSILGKYKQLEYNLAYDKAVEVLSLISDEELEDIFTKYPALFSKLAGMSETTYNITDIEKAIEVFIQTIESRNLTQDEFDAMTLDDIKGYMDSIIKKKAPVLLRIINELENDTRVKAD